MTVVVAVAVDSGGRAVPPAHEQPHREEHDQRRDGGLRTALDVLGQVALGEQDRDAEGDEGDRVPRAPPQAEASGRGGRALATGRDERRDGSDVVGIGRVPQAEQHGDEQDDRDRRPVRHSRDPVVQPEHLSAPLGR
jgi:hypothetical protein